MFIKKTRSNKDIWSCLRNKHQKINRMIYKKKPIGLKTRLISMYMIHNSEAC